MQPCRPPPTGWTAWRTTSSLVRCCWLKTQRRRYSSKRCRRVYFCSSLSLVFHLSISSNPSQRCNTFLQTLEKDVGHIAEDVKLSQALLAQSSGLGHDDRTLLEDNLDCLKERLGALGCALGQRCDHMRTRAHELTAYQVMLVFLVKMFCNLISIQNSEDVHVNVLQTTSLNPDRAATSPDFLN